MADPLKVARLVIAHPEQLGQREARQDRIGGIFQDIFTPYRSIDRVHLRLAALIAPDQRGTDHGVSFIQNHQTVHLA